MGQGVIRNFAWEEVEFFSFVLTEKNDLKSSLPSPKKKVNNVVIFVYACKEIQ